MPNRTKIICTIGPSCDSVEMIIRMMEAGMNIARLNFSHGTHQEHLKKINALKEARERMQQPLAIMLDTKGPEIRIGKLAQGKIQAEAGQNLLLVKNPTPTANDQIPINPPYILDKLEIGAKILFDDGYVISTVEKKVEEGVVVTISNKGIITSGKGVNIPGAHLDMPAVTEQDIEDLKFGCREDIDIVAASFIRSADHLLQIKKILSDENRQDIQIVAKIENAEGVQNFDSIVQIADGIMIARGDLGVEVPLSEVPKLQKMMIRKCYLAGKPSVIATQMLESMIHNPRPTRAEASDVANAIYDSTSCVMLSGETAVGKYPIEVIETMHDIVQQAEADFDYQSFFSRNADLVYHDVASAVTFATVKTAYGSGANAIFAFTSSGSTARMLSRLRPRMPILALTPFKKTYHQLSFNWGIIPALSENCQSFEEAFSESSKIALQKGYVKYGDLVVITAGSPFGVSGTTNMMIVENIGDVLVRGYVGNGQRVCGQIAIALTPDEKPPYAIKNRIIVIPSCDDRYLPLLKLAKGVILQNHIDDIDSEKYLMLMSQSLDKPALVRADGALTMLKEGQLVTLDPAKALVYKGTVKVE